MGKTKLKGVLLHLEPEKFALLKGLRTKTRIPQSVLLREAVDDLLLKYRALKAENRKRPIS